VAAGIEATSDGSIWAAWCDAVGLDDVYYDWSHVAIWAREWGCEPVGVRFEGSGGHVHLVVLKHALDALAGGAGRCDVKTAYDFGGPVVTGDLAVLDAFSTAWDALLADWGAVTEFQRLHPFHLEWTDGLLPGVVKHTDNLVVDLSAGYDAVRAGYYGSWRRDLQKAERYADAGALTARVVESPDDGDIAVFARLYAQTMEGLEAPPWYRFSDATHAALLRHPATALIRVDAPTGPAAAAISLRSSDTRFYHLSASEWALRKRFPNHLLLDTLIRHALEDGCARVHLGGGAPSLKRFKSRVANAAVPYFVRKRVVDEDVLAAICAANDLPTGPSFPPWLGRVS
jgi:hypothetical protein